MAKKLYDEKKIQFIAEKIRINSETTKRYKVSEMPEGIDEVYNKGYDVGHTAGYDDGCASGLEEGRRANIRYHIASICPNMDRRAKKIALVRELVPGRRLAQAIRFTDMRLSPVCS